MSETWMDIHHAIDPVPSVAYRSGLSVFEEALVDGQLVGRSWNGSGFLSAWDSVRIDHTAHSMPQSFVLELDGQFLGSHWDWVGFEQLDFPGGTEGVIRLRHRVRPVSVAVHTRLDGTPVMTRWLEITNDGERAAALSSVAPWSGVLQTVKRWTAHLSDPTQPLFSVGYMAGDRWGDEGRFEWQQLPIGGFRVDGRYRRDRYRHPMFIIRNHATGEHCFGQLAWSGGFSFEFDLDADPLIGDGTARLWFRAGPDAPAPQRILAPGETVRTAEVHLGMTFGDLDASVQAMHDHLRQSVLRPPARGRTGGLVESGIGPEVEITPAGVHAQIDRAAALGAEVFFIDASWYTPPGGSWYDTVGDWVVDRDRFPDGVAPFRDHVRARGMLFGLWMDAERLGNLSRTLAAHPDWLSTGYDGTRRLGGMLDLTDPTVATWMEDQIAQVITEHDLEFFRLDQNVGTVRAAGMVERDGFIENGYWRYTEALYAVYDRLRARFPAVIFENCAGGGGRTDVGMVQRFSHTDVTDWQVAPRAFRITNGMTIALPPEMTDRLVGGQDGHITADLDFQSRLLLFMVPKVSIFDPPGAALNPRQVGRIRHMIDLYTSFVRPFMVTGRMYHHTPVVAGLEPQGWGVLELASRERDRAIAGVFRLSSPDGGTYTLRPRGLDRSRRYRATWDGSGDSYERDGAEIMDGGLHIRLDGALTSELLLFEALDLR